MDDNDKAIREFVEEVAKAAGVPLRAVYSGFSASGGVGGVPQNLAAVVAIIGGRKSSSIDSAYRWLLDDIREAGDPELLRRFIGKAVERIVADPARFELSSPLDQSFWLRLEDCLPAELVRRHS